jgi:hypothetical protein
LSLSCTNDFGCLCFDFGDFLHLLGNLDVALVFSLYLDHFSFSFALHFISGLNDERLSINFFLLKLCVCFNLGLFSFRLLVDLGNTLLGICLDDLEFSAIKSNLLGEVFLDAVSLLVSSLSECFKLFLIVDDTHVKVVLFSLLIIQRSKLSLFVERVLDFLWQCNISNDDIGEFQAFVCKHVVQELEHFSSIGGALDLVDFKVSLSSDEDSNSFGDGGLKLLVQLVD